MPRGRDGASAFGFVTYGSAKEAQDAADNLNGREIDGSIIRVNIARPRPARPRDVYRPSSKLYVGNLPMDTTEGDLERLYEKYGSIRAVQLKEVRRRVSFVPAQLQRAQCVMLSLLHARHRCAIHPDSASSNSTTIEMPQRRYVNASCVLLCSVVHVECVISFHFLNTTTFACCRQLEGTNRKEFNGAFLRVEFANSRR